MWFGYNPQIIFYHFFCYFNLGIFLAFLLSKLMDTGYNNNGGGHKFSEFACLFIFLSLQWKFLSQISQLLLEPVFSNFVNIFRMAKCIV